MTAATEALFESNLHSLELLARGKVRDIYRVDAKRLLILATDRISAFDVVLPDPIPGKGAVLTAISNFWFAKLAGVLPNHLTGVDPASVLADPRDHAAVKDRAVVVHDGVIAHDGSVPRPAGHHAHPGHDHVHPHAPDDKPGLWGNR